MWTLLPILIISAPASAEDECDATLLTEALAETSPTAIPTAWLELHQCDEAVAKESIDIVNGCEIRSKIIFGWIVGCIN